MSTREEQMKREVDEIVEKLVNFVNPFGHEKYAHYFAERITSQHRTLQQGIFRLFLETIKEWGSFKKKLLYDLRNEQTVKICKKMMEAIPEEELHLPFV